jgi:hypothetical protein
MSGSVFLCQPCRAALTRPVILQHLSSWPRGRKAGAFPFKTLSNAIRSTGA